MKTIFDYVSYRLFLQDGYLREKKASKKTTLALYAKKFEMSTASLNMIFSGQRNLTLESLHHIAKLLKLSKAEHEYFEALVLREQSKPDSAARRYYAQKLKEILKTAPTKNVRIADKNFVSDWLLPILLIYLVDFEFKENGVRAIENIEREMLAKKLGISADRLSLLLKTIKDSELIQIDSNDNVHIIFEKITADGPQKEYVKSVLNQLLVRLDHDFKRSDTMSRAFAFTVEKEAIPELRKEMTLVFEKFMSRVSQNPRENTLLQVYAGFFPVM